MVSNPTNALVLIDFPEEDANDPKRLFAEYAILGGMLIAKPNFIEAGANTEFSYPMNEAIARACVEAWEHHGADTDEAWRCHCSAFLARYTGRSPLADPLMRAWVFQMIGFYELQFTQVVSDEHLAHLDDLNQWLIEAVKEKARLDAIEIGEGSVMNYSAPNTVGLASSSVEVG